MSSTLYLEYLVKELQRIRNEQINRILELCNDVDRHDAFITYHGFWTQVAIAALMQILDYHWRALSEVMPLEPPSWR